MISVEVTSSGPRSIDLTCPNGGDSWLANNPAYITWTATGVSSVALEYSTDNRSTWTTIDADVKTTDLEWGAYFWIVADVNSDECAVRVTDNGSATSDESAVTFEIVKPMITILNPIAGDVWYVGTTRTIEWTASGVSDVSRILWRKINEE